MTLQRSLRAGLPAFTIAFALSVMAGSAEGQATTPGSTGGKALYAAHCSVCHGTDGKGDGLAAPYLHPRPRNFQSGIFKFRSTESGGLPTNEDLERVVGGGLPGTSMPAAGPFLKSDSLKLIVEYIKSFSHRFSVEDPKGVRIPEAAASTPTNLARGKAVFMKLECAKCHGFDGAGKGATAVALVDVWGDSIRPTDLTEPWTFRGGSTPEQIFLRIRTGIDGTPMPSYAGSAKDAEMMDLALYVRSLARKPVWSMTAGELSAFYDSLDRRARSFPLERGKYLALSLGCKSCHTPTHSDGSAIEALAFAGGLHWTIGPYGEFFTNNLTPDKATGLGTWSDEEIKRAITQGIGKDGRRFLPMVMPWTAFANLSQDDLADLIAYFRSLPPVSNDIPKPQPLNIFSYMWGKFKMLILREDFPVEVHAGNSGSASTSSASSTSGDDGNRKEASR